MILRISGRTNTLWAVAPCLLIFLFLVPDAKAVINGSLDFSYKNYETKGSNAAATKNTIFTQRYNVNYRGFLYDRRAATLDAGITYDVQNNEYAEQKSDTKSLGFTFTTVVLPRSLIPFTIYANRYTSDSQSRPNPGYKTTNMVYGFYWALPFKGKIPEVNISYNENRLKDDSPTNRRDEISRMTNLTLTKRKKLTYYWLNYRYGTTGSQGGSGETEQSLDFKGWWRATPNSLVDFTSSLQDSQGEKFFKNRLHYDVTFSRDASARADYEYDSIENEGSETTQHGFAASLYYKPTTKITSTTAYSFGLTDAGSSSSTNNHISESVTVTVLPTLTVNGDTSYTTQSGDSSTSNWRYNLGALYFKNFSRAQWSLGANMGYTIMSGVTSERQFTRSEYTGISSRNLRYMNATASISNYSTQSSTSTSRDEYQFVISASSNYFRRMTLLANYNYNIVKEDLQTAKSSRRTFSTFDTRATYSLGYGMAVGAGYNLRTSTDSNAEHHTYIDWNWHFSLFRRIAVSMSARRETRTADDQNDSTSYSYSSKAAYRIGRLMLTLEYSYLKEDRKINDTQERTYFIRATRTF